MSEDYNLGAMNALADELEAIQGAVQGLTAGFRALGNVFPKKKLSDKLHDLLTGSTKDAFKKVFNVFKDTKFLKGAKELGKTLKSMMGASIAVFGLQQLMTLLEPFLGLLDLFVPIVEVLAGIFQEALLPLIKEILPVVMFLISILQENKQVIMTLVQYALLPLMALFVFFNALITDTQKVINLLIGLALMPLYTIFKVITHILVGASLVPALELLANVFMIIEGIVIAYFTTLQTIANWLVNKFNPIWVGLWTTLVVMGNWISGIFSGIWGGIIAIWNATAGRLFGPNGIIASAFTGLLTIGKAIANSFIAGINSVIKTINLIPGVSLSKLPMLEAGGTALGPYIGGEKGAEEVIPLERESVVLNALEEIAFESRRSRILTEELLEQQRRNGRGMRITKRRFG